MNLLLLLQPDETHAVRKRSAKRRRRNRKLKSRWYALRARIGDPAMKPKVGRKRRRHLERKSRKYYKLSLMLQLN